MQIEKPVVGHLGSACLLVSPPSSALCVRLPGKANKQRGGVRDLEIDSFTFLFALNRLFCAS
jgi:hypothetical protein